jgi:hypothetical protein
MELGTNMHNELGQQLCGFRGTRTFCDVLSPSDVNLVNSHSDWTFQQCRTMVQSN